MVCVYPDDGDPYDPAWLPTVGFRPVYNGVTGVTLTEGVHLHHIPGQATPFILTDGRLTYLALPPLPTKGHVRRLLRALGVTDWLPAAPFPAPAALAPAGGPPTVGPPPTSS